MSLSVHRSDFTVKAGHGLATLYLWARNPLFHTATILPGPRIFSLGRLPPATNAMEYTLPHRGCVRPLFRVNITGKKFGAASTADWKIEDITWTGSKTGYGFQAPLLSRRSGPVVKQFLATTPSARASVASQLFLDRASTLLLLRRENRGNFRSLTAIWTGIPVQEANTGRSRGLLVSRTMPVCSGIRC
jgi:hypothetical protein